MNSSSHIPPSYQRPLYAPAPPPRPPGPEYGLHIIQQPERGKVVIKGKEKDRKPIDPPPIVQLHGRTDYSPCPYWFNPYIFCTVTLFHETEDRAKERDDTTIPPLVGYTSSSLHRLKDLTNTEGAFFVFGDFAATVTGRARLHFNLWEMDPSTGTVMMHQSATSHPFDVQVPRDWEGVKESTILSRTFSDQGVKLRLRKESRAAQRRRSFHPPPTMTHLQQPPLRPHPSTQSSFDDPQQSYRSHPSAQGSYNDPQHPLRSQSRASFDDTAEDGLEERDAKRPRTYATSMALNYSNQTTASAYAQTPQQPGYGANVGTPDQHAYSTTPSTGYGSTASPNYASSHSQGHGQSSYGQAPPAYGPGYQHYPHAAYNPSPYGQHSHYSAPPPHGHYGQNQYPGYNYGPGYGGYSNVYPDHYNQQHGSLPSRGGAYQAPTLPPTSSIASSTRPHYATSIQANTLPPLANLPSISGPPASQQPTSGPE